MTQQKSGILRKMRARIEDTVQYEFIIGDELVPMNELIGGEISLRSLDEIFCIQCGRKTSKSFQQGFCFPCMQRLNECGNCAIHPERCKVEQGGCPKDDWAHSHCAAEQIVYLANSSNTKIGVTRLTQVPTRWIDQGAMQALPMFRTSNRYQAGVIEVIFKQYVADKTNWRTMLKQDSVAVDLVSESKRLIVEAKLELDEVIQQYPDEISLLQPEIYDLLFPVTHYPEKIVSLSLDKMPEVSGQLLGIKGQYLILDKGVINIRKFGGYVVQFSY
jgi:hypothetical protein